MKPLYPINQSIEDLIASSIDEETGELTLSDEEMAAEMARLQMEFDEGITELRNEFINLSAYAEALKNEKQSLARRQRIAEAQAERTKRFLAYLLKGEKYQNGTVSISYRKSQEVVCDDEFVEWAAVYAPGLLSFKAPEPRKADIKAAMKRGQAFEHCHLETRNNIQVK